MIEKNTIVSLKLLTGEEVCGKFLDEDMYKIDLDKPFRLIQTEQGFGFVPMMVTTDPTLPHSVFKTGVAVLTPTFKDIIEQYTLAVSQIPDAQAQVKSATKVNTTPVSSTQSLNKKSKLKA